MPRTFLQTIERLSLNLRSNLFLPSRQPQLSETWTGPFQSKRGFTLIEILVVIGIIALVTTIALPSLMSFFKVSLSTAGREVATVVRETYNASVITGRIYRVVYDFKSQSYWAEGGPTTLLLDTAATKEEEERRRRYLSPSELEKLKNKDSGFTLDKAITRKKRALPDGVSIVSITTDQAKEPITEGEATTHFFPHGLTERTLIVLKDLSSNYVTLAIQPLLGKTELFERQVTLKEAYEQ